jgi:hypothetical protein
LYKREHRVGAVAIAVAAAANIVVVTIRVAARRYDFIL